MAVVEYIKFSKQIGLIITLFFFSTMVNSQSINVPPKLLATYNTHFSVSLGGDVSYVGKNGELGLIQLSGETKGNNIRFRETASWSVNLGLDMYSPNGILGLYVAAEYNSQKYSVQGTPNQRLDSISSRNIEIPAYLKFRLGKTTGTSHVWLAMGGGYNIPLKAKFNSSRGSSTISTEPFAIDLFKPIPFLSSMIGYEYYLKAKNGQHVSSVRGLIYVKGNYDLGNRIDSSFVPIPESSLSQIDSLDIRFLRISFGLRLLFG